MFSYSKESLAIYPSFLIMTNLSRNQKGGIYCEGLKSMESIEIYLPLSFFERKEEIGFE